MMPPRAAEVRRKRITPPPVIEQQVGPGTPAQNVSNQPQPQSNLMRSSAFSFLFLGLMTYLSAATGQQTGWRIVTGAAQRRRYTEFFPGNQCEYRHHLDAIRTTDRQGADQG